MKNCLLGAELFHVYRWIDRHDEANSCFLIFLERG